jgi:anti-anti-sigma factor
MTHTPRQRTDSEQSLQAILQALSFAAEQFLQTTGLQSHIQAVLERMGLATQVSRVYIFQNHYDEQENLLMSQRYEWNAEGVEPQIDNPELQNLSYEEMGFERWREVLSQKQPLYGIISSFPEGERAVLEPQDIRSIIVVPIFVGKHWWGFVGFDDCEQERNWYVSEVDALQAIANLIGVAIQHEQLQDRLRHARNDLARQVRERTEELRVFQIIVENSPDGVFVAGMDGILTYANTAFRTMYGYGEEIVGIHISRLAQHDESRVQRLLDNLRNNSVWQGTVIHERKDGTTFPVHVSTMLIRDYRGEDHLLVSFHHDITEQLHQEEERAAMQQEVIDAQRAAIRELSTPLIPLSAQVVLLPLIGNMDTQRAQMVMETLLEGIAQHQASVAILDITGVAVIDTQVAQALVQSAQAVRLLGAQVVLTGIGPTMAQTLVSLGADLSSIVTRGSLQNGILWAMQHREG